MFEKLIVWTDLACRWFMEALTRLFTKLPPFWSSILKAETYVRTFSVFIHSTLCATCRYSYRSIQLTWFIYHGFSSLYKFARIQWVFSTLTTTMSNTFTPNISIEGDRMYPHSPWSSSCNPTSSGDVHHVGRQVSSGYDHNKPYPSPGDNAMNFAIVRHFALVSNNCIHS